MQRNKSHSTQHSIRTGTTVAKLLLPLNVPAFVTDFNESARACERERERERVIELFVDRRSGVSVGLWN